MGINRAGHLALKTTTLPVLGNILLKTEKNYLTVTTTNLEAGIHHQIRGKVEEEGECLVPAKLILDLIPLLPEGNILIKKNNSGLIITANKIKTTLRTTPTTEFPIIPSIENPSHKLIINTQQLEGALNKTIFAAGHADQKPQFNGLLLAINDSNGKKISIVATDGYRLSEVVLTTNKEHATHKLIIPLATAQELQRVLYQQEEENIEIQANDNQINFTVGPTQIISRLIDGEYPDYQPLFPDKTLTECVVLKNDLARAIKAASLFSRVGIFDISLKASPGHPLEISAENAGVGSNSTSLEAETTGEEVTVVINARYLLDGLGAMGGERVKILLTGAERPILLQSSNGVEKIDFRHLIVLIKQA